MSQNGGQVRPVTFNVNVGYAKSVLGISKVIQFVLLLLTWACMADCCRGSDPLFGGRYGFYLFVTIFGWLCIICIYSWFLLTLQEKIKLPAAIADGVLVVLLFEILWTLLLLISAAMVAEVANYYGALKSFGGGSVLKSVYNTMVASVIFGFFALVLFIVDIVFLVIKLVKSKQSGQVAAAGNQPTA